MGRPQVRLQTESKTDRRFTTIRVKRNVNTSYHKVYLHTKDEEVGRRRRVRDRSGSFGIGRSGIPIPVPPVVLG